MLWIGVVDRGIGGVLLRLSSNALRFFLHAVDEAHAGAHERQQLRAFHFSPATGIGNISGVED